MVESKPDYGRWLLLLPCLAVMLLYWPCLDGEFVFDDQPLVVKNAGLWQGSGFDLRIWNTPDPQSVNDGPRVNFRPIRFLSYQLDAWLTQKTWGDEDRRPFFFHLQNIILHALNTLLVGLLIRRLWPKLPNWGAPLMAALFALHPVQTESVAYVSGRRDVLFLFFYLSCILFYAWRRRSASWGTGVVCGLLFLLALASKEMAISLPFALAGYELLASRDDSKRRWPLGVWAPLLLCGTTFLWTWKTFQNPGLGAGYWGGSLWTALATSARVSFHYLGLLLWPQTLTIDYSYNAFGASRGWLQPMSTLFSVLGVIGAVAVASWAWRRKRVCLSLGIVLFYVFLGPVSQMVPHPERMAERFLYLPSLAVLLAFSQLIPARWRDPQMWGIPLLLVVALFSVRTHIRLEDWEQRYTLWRSAIEAYPQCARAHVAYGDAAAQLGYYDEATTAFKKANDLLRRSPERLTAGGRLQQGYFIHSLAQWSSLVASSTNKARQELALAGYHELIADTDTTGEPISDNPEIVAQLLELEHRLGHREPAMRWATHLLELPTIAPSQRTTAYGVLLDQAAAANNAEQTRELLDAWEARCTDTKERGRLLFHRGELLRNDKQWSAARECFEKVEEIFAGTRSAATARFEIAECLLNEGKVNAARDLFTDVGEGPPLHIPALLRSAELAGTMKDYDEADRQYMLILAAQPDNPYARQGRAQLLAKKKLLANPEASVNTIKPSKGFALLQLAEKKVASNEIDKAVKALVEADPHLEGEPQRKHRLRVRLLAARLCGQLSQWQDARSWYQKYLEIAVEDQRSDAVIELATLLQRDKEYRLASELLEGEYGRGIRHPDLTRMLFEIALRRGERPTALRWIELRLQEEGLREDEKARLTTLLEVLKTSAGADSSSDDNDSSQPPRELRE